MESIIYGNKTIVTGFMTPLDVETEENLEAFYRTDELLEYRGQFPELLPPTFAEYKERYPRVAIIMANGQVIDSIPMPEGMGLWEFSKMPGFADAMRRYR